MHRSLLVNIKSCDNMATFWTVERWTLVNMRKHSALLVTTTNLKRYPRVASLSNHHLPCSKPPSLAVFSLLCASIHLVALYPLLLSLVVFMASFVYKRGESPNALCTHRLVTDILLAQMGTRLLINASSTRREWLTCNFSRRKERVQFDKVRA